MSNNYPRMLYRAGKGQGNMAWGHRMDTLTVQSPSEEDVAIRKGWTTDPNRAIKGAVWRQRWASAFRFYLRNWQWLWGTAVAAALAILFHG